MILCLYRLAVAYCKLLLFWQNRSFHPKCNILEGITAQLDTAMDPAGLCTFLWAVMCWASSAYQTHLRFWETSWVSKFPLTASPNTMGLLLLMCMYHSQPEHQSWPALCLLLAHTHGEAPQSRGLLLCQSAVKIQSSSFDSVNISSRARQSRKKSWAKQQSGDPNQLLCDLIQECCSSRGTNSCLTELVQADTAHPRHGMTSYGNTVLNRENYSVWIPAHSSS